MLATIRPNEDAHIVLERTADAAGIARARVCGIGSLVSTRSPTGPKWAAMPPEIWLTGGRIECRHATLDPISVGLDGRHIAGWHERDNRVGSASPATR